MLLPPHPIIALYKLGLVLQFMCKLLPVDFIPSSHVLFIIFNEFILYVKLQQEGNAEYEFHCIGYSTAL